MGKDKYNIIISWTQIAIGIISIIITITIALYSQYFAINRFIAKKIDETNKIVQELQHEVEEMKMEFEK